MKQPHWVWATDANTHERVCLNLGVVQMMFLRKMGDGREVTVIPLGGIAIDQNGAAQYAQMFVTEKPAELLVSPPIPLADPLPKSVARLAKPHSKDK